MSKKHFEALAATLRANKPDGNGLYCRGPAYDQWQTDCCAVADACRDANPRFDVGKFLSACGVQ
jgi:hypothetical protein